MRPATRTARRVLPALATTLALAAPAIVLAPPAGAVGETVRGVSFDVGQISVDGFGSAAVRVSADLDLAGTVTRCSGKPARLAATPWVRLTRTTGATGVAVDDVVDVALTTSPGAPEVTAGTWSGTWQVGATRSGTWTVTEVGACTPSSPTGWSQDPRALGLAATVTVAGTNAPKFVVAATPVVWGVRATTVRATVTDAARRPVARRGVTFGQGAACGSTSDGSRVVPTNAAGVATVTMNPKLTMCAYLATPAAAGLSIDTGQALLLRRTIAPRYYFRAISGFPLNTVVVRGRSVVVSGSLTPRASLVGPGTTHRVALQVRSGRGWRTVGTSAVAASGRFSVGARTTTRGIVSYRVLATSNRVMLPTTGQPLLVVVI